MLHRTPRWPQGGTILALALCVLPAACIVDSARAEPRFGDSTWVAPSALIEGDVEAAGPRVARPDHERRWETVLRAPFRLAFLPLRLLTRGIEAAGPTAEEFHTSKGRIQVSPEWIGATVAVPAFLGPGSKIGLTGAWSPRDSRKARIRAHAGDSVSFLGGGIDALYDYRPNRRFYGIGNFSSSDPTYFLRRADLASAYLFAGRDPLRRVRASVGISDVGIGQGYNGSPRSVDVFNPTDVPFLTQGSQVWWLGVGGDFAALDGAEPSEGVHLRPEVRRFRSSDGSELRFDDWRVEARGYLPVFSRRRVIAARLVYEGVDPRSGSAPVPFYRLAESSDANHFAGYPTGRFRDRRLAIGHAEYRWEIMRPVWAFGLAELGEVASTSSRLTLRAAHPSLGGGLRARISPGQVAEIEAARGHEGLNVKADLEARF